MRNPHTCPKCEGSSISIIDSRMQADGSSKKRRLVCRKCDHRWNTHEISEGRYNFLLKIRRMWSQIVTTADGIVAAVREVKIDEDQ